MSRNFYVTTPIYYVNDRPHIGHAYTTILADVLARYHRWMGESAWFLTGTDEHGQKVHQAAERAGISPQEQADRTVVRFMDLWKRLEITNDDFIRTTEPRHKEVVREILQDLYDRGEIYRADYDGWYDVGSETFVTEKDLNVPEGKTPADLPGIVRIREANYFFRMGAYQEWLVEYIESHPEFIRPATRRNETLGFLRTKKLADLCISRPKSRLAWGIELPFDADYVCYVWFDALVNYISAAGYRRDEPAFARRWPATVQLIGKDILTTHTVYWPTMLKAMGLPMPRTIFAHGWWLLGDAKMSKSAGNVVDPMAMIDKYGVDAFRYFLIAEMTMGQDASFSEDAFVRRYNSDLANDLGNLLSRVVSMIGRYCGGRVPEPVGTPVHGAEKEVWKALQTAADSMRTAVAANQLDRGVGDVIAAVRATNRYIEICAPWSQAKQPDKGPLNTTLYTAAEAIRVAAALLHPVMPERMSEVRRCLGLSTAEPHAAEAKEWGVIPSGAAVQASAPLFPRIDPAGASPQADAAPAPVKAKPPAPNEAPPQVTRDEFMKMDLRTARVTAAEKVQGADKLLRLQVDVGGEPRQIVAGIALHYAPESLVGRTILIVANLAPAIIRGVESRGMLLAVTDGDAVRLVGVDGEVRTGLRAK